MVRRQRPPVARRGLTAAALLALVCAGCGGRSNVQFASSSSPPTGNSSGASVSVQGSSTAAALAAIVILSGVAYRSEQGVLPAQRVPEMDPTRRVVEQDCTKPIADWSANLRCR